MEGIPPARASDNEQVTWALQTAESLWKRNARVDAIVWLRRAAEGAAESGDDDRASALLGEAAVLTESISGVSTKSRVAAPTTAPPPPPGDDEDIDALLASGSDLGGVDAPEDDGIEELDDEDLISLAPATPIPTGEPSLLPVPPAASPGEIRAELDFIKGPSSETPELGGSDDARDHGRPTLDVLIIPASEAPTPHFADEAPTRDVRNPFAGIEGVSQLGDGALSAMDLAAVAALAPLTPGEREHLVRGAAVILCASGALVPDFGFALVLEGEVTATTGSGTIIARLGAGASLSAQGTLDEPSMPKLVVTADETTIALWSLANLTDALVEAPAVASTLLAEGDKLQAWARIAESSLASRLHEEVRLRLLGRLVPRTLRPGAELIAAGQPVPGIFLVGKGNVVIDEPIPKMLAPGRFVFAGATLSAARASATARAGDGGAVVLEADRRTTQELYATEPLLLELLAADD